ncbi:MAG: choice-of-anchor R domain-containing protein [Nitrososphaerota archaeon]
MTELIIVSKPRLRFVKWVGGGVYKQYLAQLSTPTIYPATGYLSGTRTAWRNLYTGSGGTTRAATQFTAVQSASVQNLRLVRAWCTLAKSGSPSGTLYVRLYSDNNNVPGSSLATIGSLSVTSLTTSPTEYTFTPASPISLTQGTKYWIVVEYSGGSSSNYVIIYTGTSGNLTIRAYSSDTTWTVESNTICASVGHYSLTMVQTVDFVYSGVAEKRLKVIPDSGSTIINERRLNGQSLSGDPVETQSIPQTSQYIIEYDVTGNNMWGTVAAWFRWTTTRYLYYAGSSITLDQLGGSEAYVARVSSGNAFHLRIDDNPDADLITSGGATITFEPGTLPFRKLEWVSGGGEVDILVVE